MLQQFRHNHLEGHVAKFAHRTVQTPVSPIRVSIVLYHWTPFTGHGLGTTIHAAYHSFQIYLFSGVPQTFVCAISSLIKLCRLQCNIEGPNAPIQQSFGTLGLVDRYDLLSLSLLVMDYLEAMPPRYIEGIIQR